MSDKNNDQKATLAIAALQLARQALAAKREKDVREQSALDRLSTHLPESIQRQLPAYKQELAHQEAQKKIVITGGATLGIFAMAGIGYLAWRGNLKGRVQEIVKSDQPIQDKALPLANSVVTAVKSGSQNATDTLKGAAKQKVHDVIDEKTAPIKKKAILYGVLGFIALTLYIILVATTVALIVRAV